MYSYDHINNILDEIGDVLIDCKTTVENNTIMMDELKTGLNTRMEAIENQVKEFKVFTDDFLTKNSIIDIGQLPRDIVDRAIKSLNHINVSIKLKDGVYEYKVKDVYPEDYLTAIHRKYVGSIDLTLDEYWIRGTHYEIEEDAVYPGTYIVKILTEDFNLSAESDELFLTGLKISNKRNF